MSYSVPPKVLHMHIHVYSTYVHAYTCTYIHRWRVQCAVMHMHVHVYSMYVHACTRRAHIHTYTGGMFKCAVTKVLHVAPFPANGVGHTQSMYTYIRIYIHTYTGGMFNALSQKCCTSLLFPPMEWDFPVHNPHQIIGQVNTHKYVYVCMYVCMYAYLCNVYIDGWRFVCIQTCIHSQNVCSPGQ
jgi:hypothetical protein